MEIKYSEDQPRDDQGRFAPAGGGSEAHEIRQGTLGDFESLTSDVKPSSYPKGSRAWRAAAVIRAMDAAEPFYVAKRSGKIVGAMNFRFTHGELRLDFLAVHPDVINGNVKTKGVGTSLMQQAAKLAATKNSRLSLESLDSESDKFYRAIGMTKYLTNEDGKSEWMWTAEQCKKIANVKAFDAPALLERAREVEDKHPPLAGSLKSKHPKSQSLAVAAIHYQTR